MTNKEYKEITNEIINHEQFKCLKNDVHHGSNKYDHCKRVSYLSYIMSRVFKANSSEVARAGLLHDFFFGSRTLKKENDYLQHPETSLNNALNYFSLNSNEQNIIKSHMFHCAIIKKFTPFLKEYEEDKKYFKENKPNSKESVIVCIADLIVSIFEVIRFKIRYNTALYVLFILNIIRY